MASDEKAKQKVTAVEGQPLKLRMTVNKKDLLEFVGFNIISFQIIKLTQLDLALTSTVFSLFCLLSKKG